MNFELLNPIPPDDYSYLQVARVGAFGSGWYVIACKHTLEYEEVTVAGPFGYDDAHVARKQCEELRALTKRLTS